MYARRLAREVVARPGEEPDDVFDARDVAPFERNARARDAWARVTASEANGRASASGTSGVNSDALASLDARDVLRRLRVMPSDEAIARARRVREGPWTRRALEGGGGATSGGRASGAKGGRAGKRRGTSSDETVDDERAKRLREIAREAIEKAGEATRLRAEESARFLETRNFAGKMVEIETEFVEGTKEAKAHTKRVEAIARGGIDAVLAQLMEPKKLTTLDKTKADWRSVKDDDAELQEDLQHHARGGQTYREQQEFLLNADFREYERERDARLAAQSKRAAPSNA